MCLDLRIFFHYFFHIQIFCIFFSDLIRQIFRFLFGDLIRQIFRFLSGDLICQIFRFLSSCCLFQLYCIFIEFPGFQILLRRSLPAGKDIFQTHLSCYLVIILSGILCDFRILVYKLRVLIYDLCVLIDDFCILIDDLRILVYDLCVLVYDLCVLIYDLRIFILKLRRIFRKKFFRIFKCDFFRLLCIDLIRQDLSHPTGRCDSFSFLFFRDLSNDLHISHRLDLSDLFSQIVQHWFFFLFRLWFISRVKELFQSLSKRHCISDLLSLRLHLNNIFAAVSIFPSGRLFFNRFSSLGNTFLSDISGLLTSFRIGDIAPLIRSLILTFRLCICQDIRHLFRLFGKLLIPPVILFLLGRSQRLVLHLQFHRLIHILPFTEPEDKIIALLQALCRHTGLLVQFRQLIRPLFNILRLLILLKSLDLLLDRSSLRAEDLVFQYILIRVFRRDLNKVVIIINSFVHILCLDRQGTEAADDLPAPLRTAVSKVQHFISLLILFVLFIDLTDICQHSGIADSLPVDLIRDLRRLPVCTVLHKFEHLFGLYFIIILIHRIHLVENIFHRSAIIFLPFRSQADILSIVYHKHPPMSKKCILN